MQFCVHAFACFVSHSSLVFARWCHVGNLVGEKKTLGSVLVVSSSGEVLYHHKEKTWGDHPEFDDLKAAIAKLS